MKLTGHLHPLTTLTAQLVKHFQGYGFEVVLGPEIVTEENNFDLLNVPADHPARDEHDTFYLQNGRLLRTHTTAMQIPTMKDKTPPVRLLFPGRSFRNEATDSMHNTNFFQLDGLVIGPDASLSSLIGTIQSMLKAVLGNDIEFRFRPGYFPFTEPSIEADIRRVGEQRWTELMGAGMVHPKVIRNMGLDPSQTSGFAFGIGLDRLLVTITGIDDVRLLLSGDYRLIGQF